MAQSTTSPESFGIRYGLMAAVAMIAYFLFINMIHLQDVEIVRFASNILIILAVVWAIYAFKNNYRNQVPYLPGLAIGFLVGLIGSVVYAFFIYVYAKFLNPDYATVLNTQDYYGSVLSPMMLAGAITILGTAVGTMTGYILMMAFDNSGARTAE